MKYKNFLLNNSNFNILQSLEWCELKTEWKNEVVYLEENGEIVASISLLLRKIPIINAYMAYGSRGPIAEINDEKILKLLLKEAELLKSKYNIFLIRIDPRWKKDEVNISKYKKTFKIRKKVSTRLLIQPKYNMIVGLNRGGEEDIFASFSESTRRNIRKAIKNGCKVEMCTDLKALQQFFDLHVITGKRDKFIVRNENYFRKLYSLFINKGLTIWNVTHEGDLIGSAILLESGQTMWYYAGASSNNKRKLKANHLLQWEMMKYAKRKGFNYYDLGGIYATNEKEEPLYRFKHGFCKYEGVTEFIGEMDYVLNKFKYNIYVCIERLNIYRKKLIMLKNNIKRKFQ